MNRSVIFDSPFLLGFEHTRNLIERAAKAAAESYPPYNVEDLGELQESLKASVDPAVDPVVEKVEGRAGQHIDRGLASGVAQRP